MQRLSMLEKQMTDFKMRIIAHEGGAE